MNKVLNLILLYILITVFPLSAQLDCSFQHYGSEDGLPQSNIMDILQDRKGFMWFSTWDGLAKFDGYNFETIKLPNDKDTSSKSNRIDKIYEDKYGNIWVVFYDHMVYRYNPKTEIFKSIDAGLDNKTFYTTRVIPQESGKVWLLSENNGCIYISDSLANARVCNTSNNFLPDDIIYDIVEDNKTNNWILTNKGILLLDSKNESKLFLNNDSDYFPKKDYPVYCALQMDHEMWFGSNNGTIWVYSYDDERIKQITSDINSQILSLHKISDDKILIIVKDSGFLVYNIINNSFEYFNTNTCKDLNSNIIFNTYIDFLGNAWFETDKAGVSKFNSHTNSISDYAPKIESIEISVFEPNFFIFEDINKQLWIHPRGGGFGYYDRVNDKVMPFFNEPHSTDWLFSNVLHSAFSDRQGNLWMGTRSHGLEKITFFDKNIKTLHTSSQIKSTVANDVRPVFQDSENNIWIGTKDGKIHLYNEELEHIGYLNSEGNIGEDANFKGVAYCITEDSYKNIWIGTKGEGVYKLTPKRDKTYHIKNFKSSKTNIYALSDNNVYSIFEDKFKRMWIGTYGGGVNLVEQDNDSVTFINYKNKLINYPIETGSQVRIISSDKNGNIFIGSTLGLLVMSSDFNEPKEIEFREHYAQNNDYSLKANDIFDICTTRNGETFISVFGGGISRVTETDSKGFPLKFKTYSTHDGLPSKVTLSVVEDIQGNLLISSEGSITRLNQQTEIFENFSQIKRLMKQQNFSEGSRCLLKDGKILFGTSKGVLYFDSGDLSNNSYNPYLALVDFRLFNRVVPVNNKSLLKQNIDDTKEITLKYNQNFFTIEFAGLDYEEPNNINYAYKLEGFDKDWIYNNKLRTANYTNLSRGKYIFKVMSTNSNGIWSNNERALSIEVLPPIWRTWWAYFIYFVLLSVSIFYAFRFLITFYTIRQQAELERKESELKSKFFTDISHEIRTPLTMIVSPVENIIKDEATPRNIKDQLTLVSKNTGRLLTMVNQILDFRKIEKELIEVSKIEIGVFAEDICEGFIKIAEKDNIIFKVKNNAPNVNVWADADALEKILINLLSNAFKYTPKGKAINVEINEDNDFVIIKIKDQGMGISKEKLPRLFKRFESFNEDKSKPSTGIGLSIVKELMDKHNARIFVESESDIGTTFSLFFHKGTSHFSQDVLIKETAEVKTTKTYDKLEEAYIEPKSSEPKNRPTILIVEDDNDLRHFIITALEKEYNMIEAENGKEGLNKALEVIPDFIISDIMMPEMDGIEFLHNIRNNIATSHILFLLLTAKTSDIDIVDGFKSGTDEYLTKPFSVSYLKARIENLIKRRENIQEYYRSRGIVREPIVIPTNTDSVNIESNINETDSRFIEDVTNFILTNMSNFDLMVEDIAVDLGMSRTVFYKKIKGLTGFSPIEFKRDIQIQEASKILSLQKHTIKEVAFMVGFTDPKYFTKCFKQKFDMTPSHYIKTLTNNK